MLDDKCKYGEFIYDAAPPLLAGHEDGSVTTVYIETFKYFAQVSLIV